jgi:hypothetical protein
VPVITRTRSRVQATGRWLTLEQKQSTSLLPCKSSWLAQVLALKRQHMPLACKFRSSANTGVGILAWVKWPKETSWRHSTHICKQAFTITALLPTVQTTSYFCKVKRLNGTKYQQAIKERLTSPIVRRRSEKHTHAWCLVAGFWIVGCCTASTARRSISEVSCGIL